MSEAAGNHDEEYDEDDVDMNDEEEDDNDKTYQPIRSVNKPGRAAEAGVIDRVYVENFMCHRKLTVNLCKNVNFINGQNGSGKSAVLAAIQICLGAGARRTHRARNLKDLIRKESGSNCSGAKVRVTLLNRGEDAFQHDVYGDYITVERSISYKGSNGYRLLDHEMKEKSKSKKDLDDMLDQLNIQVENPVAVLDQEEAKKFLMGKAEDKYNFFSKATDLERLDRSYANISDNIESLDRKNEIIRASLPKLQENFQRLKKEYKQFQELEKLEDNHEDAKIQYSWSSYHKVVEDTQRHTSLLNDINGKLEKRKEDLEKIESANDSSEEEARLKLDLETLTEEAEKAASHKSTLEQELKQAKMPMKIAQQKIKTNNREILAAKRNHASALKALEDTRQQILNVAGTSKTAEARRMEKLRKAEEEMAKTKLAYDEKKETINSHLHKYENLEPNVEAAKSNSQSVQNQLEIVKRKLRDLQSNSGNSLSIFGQKCSAMFRKIQEHKKLFTGPCVGPIGTHIKIVQGKERFAKIAEFGLGGGNLDRFIVTNDKDRILFMKLRKDVGCSSRDCGVFQVPLGKRYDVPPPPCDDVETIESVLSIDDDLVYNCLIDNAQIDLKALSNSKEESEAALLIHDPNTQRGSIRGGKIRHVYFLPHGDHWQLNKYGSAVMVSNDNSRNMRQTIGVDRSSAIENAHNEADMLMKDLKDLRSKEAEILENFKSEKLMWNQAVKDARILKNRKQEIQNTLDALRDEAETAENVTIDTTELEEDVKTAEEALESLITKEKDLHKAIEEAKPITEKIENRLDEITTRNNSVLKDLELAEKKLHQCIGLQMKRHELIKKKRSKISQLLNAKNEQEKVVDKHIERQNKALDSARRFTFNVQERKKRGNDDVAQNLEPSNEELEAIDVISTDNDPSHYAAKIDQIGKKIERERKRRKIGGQDPVAAYEKMNKAELLMISKTEKVAELDKKREKGVKDLQSRRKRWRQFRRHITIVTNQVFDDMLNKKGSSGEITFDHQNRSLNLTVQKDNTNDQSQTHDVKALSGGERSFTTLSLLLALGESLETPFRVMDEFDVFLDAISRKIALDTMVEVAKEMEHRQFIFITPQDLSSLKPHPMLKVIKMKAPARSNKAGVGQTTIDF